MKRMLPVALCLCLNVLLSPAACAQGCIGISLADTIKACANTTVALNATLTGAAANPPLDTQWTPATGLSNPHSLAPILNVGTSSATYVLTVKALTGQNLVVNGDFSGGNTGFSSSYVYGTGGVYGPLSTEGEYVVMNNTTAAHSSFDPFGDHTTGSGNMLIVNGASTPNVNIWCQTINVLPNTEYDFSTWGATAFSTSPAILQFSINGVLLGSPFNLPGATGIWQQFHTTWFSGGNTTATICITNQNTAIFGNDFCLDDIFFRRTCVAKDSVYVAIRPEAHADFTYSITDSCLSSAAAFVNTSGYNPATAQFTWKFGDGSSYTGVTPPLHHYPGAGSYLVTLILSDTSACNTPDSVVQTLLFTSVRVQAQASVPDIPCGVFDISGSSTSVNAQGITWYFGDGQTSTQSSFTHHYAGPGTYTVMLVAVNPSACNRADTFRKTLEVGALPKAGFTHNQPDANDPVQFTNTSTGATSWLWQFGDGQSSTAKHPSHLFPRTGSYTVCLIARSTGECADTVCEPVFADVRPVADLPKAFSPNGDGHNDVLYVRGAGIAGMQLKIFNRWGQRVFESSDLSQGWDGTTNGVKQEMDAYAFLLQVTFIDGSVFTKKGNVTLIR